MSKLTQRHNRRQSIGLDEEKKICMQSPNCKGAGQTCAISSGCCSGICESGTCVSSANLACGKPGMKCRTSSDCCGVNTLCKLNRQTNFKHCRSTAASGDEKGDTVNWGLCKSDTDCKPTDRCNSNNGVCFTSEKESPGGNDKSQDEKGSGGGKTKPPRDDENGSKSNDKTKGAQKSPSPAREGKEDKSNNETKEAQESPSPSSYAKVDISPSPSSKSNNNPTQSSSGKKKKNGRRTSATSETNTDNATISSLNSSTQCLIQYTISSACQKRMWKVDGHLLKCRNGQEPLSGSGSVLLDIGTGEDTVCLPLCSDEDSSILLLGYDDLATKFILVNSLHWAFGKNDGIDFPQKNHSVSKFKKRCSLPYDPNDVRSIFSFYLIFD